ncbi:MAG: plasmid mobilization relaxosome protein MobC [Rhizobium sp.]|jgi:hypothetical protein|nr:plasmid mobilization relaxosome protein MobC [Rhizobium sp.]
MNSIGHNSDKRTGRPRKAVGERRDAHLPNVRVTAAERRHIEAQAAQAGLPLVEYCRRVIFSHRVAPKASSVDQRLVLELNRVGVNLNQIARIVNTDNAAPPEFPEVLADLRAILDRIAADGS